MFAKLFNKSPQSQTGTPYSQPDVAHESMASSEFAPRVAVHYGIPSTASILAFDPIQRLLAIGTLDGRIKVVGGDNIEGLLISPKALPFKNLEFLQNQGFLVSVSNENEIQVWDLEKRRLSSNIQWESNITAFAVISGTNFIYVGDEYGFVSVLKYDAEEANILQLPYHVPPNLIAGNWISGQSLEVLIAFENGLIILWDVTEDRAIHVRGYEDLQLKERFVLKFSNNESHTT
ncbi:UNVERIFIED_CONTAM: Syntaxin-binding protein 5-like [Sesamum radiatum]|uniref:Syntaxin-binding protein 5-like n=1 Tax=Sesamum radiatum TaxID=300843 RepID=A0AAW2TEI4_SESRA